MGEDDKMLVVRSSVHQDVLLDQEEQQAHVVFQLSEKKKFGATFGYIRDSGLGEQWQHMKSATSDARVYILILM